MIPIKNTVYVVMWHSGEYSSQSHDHIVALPSDAAARRYVTKADRVRRAVIAHADDWFRNARNQRGPCDRCLRTCHHADPSPFYDENGQRTLADTRCSDPYCVERAVGCETDGMPNDVGRYWPRCFFNPYDPRELAVSDAMETSYSMSKVPYGRAKAEKPARDC